MEKANAVVDYAVCDPSQCPAAADGKCPAVTACKHRVLKQDAKGEAPYPFGLCQGCSTCTHACPLGAIRLIK